MVHGSGKGILHLGLIKSENKKDMYHCNLFMTTYETDREKEIRMVKEMGLNPKSLIKNIPNKKEMWKAPVKDWIHDMYEERQRKAEQKEKRKQQNKSNHY